jgi:endogenous inhibitor of DNA gyrase (YacG/DUF329 family)
MAAPKDTKDMCVYCRTQPVSGQFRPFCSERCKMADLGQWLGGGYAIPSAPDADDEVDDIESEDEP